MLEKIFAMIARIMPRKIAYWCVIRVFAEATTGEYSNTVATELNFIEALKRFDK